MSDETYNGHANRETWAFNMHWQNDRTLYFAVLTYGRQLLMNDPDISDSTLGSYVVDTVRDWLTDEDMREVKGISAGTALMVRTEVGSWWRIDHEGVGSSVRESLDD